MKYDYVIVGAGSAGCVLANRLSANPNNQVLLLEAGPEDRNFWLSIPLGYGKSLTNPDINWCFESEPEVHANGKRDYLPRGKVLGGTSSINGLVYMRGHRSDYDTWAQMGCHGWSYDDVLPYFRKAETNQRGESDFHGASGPLHVSDNPELTPVSKALIEGGKEVGLQFNEDFNGPEQEGIGVPQVTSSRGRRSSTSQAYLKPVRSRPNLHVHTQAHVLKILFTGKRAGGVRYEQRGIVTEAQAGQAVLLCAGVYGSPPMLELSGVGDAERLRALGVDVIHHLPGVGEGLQDHQCFRMRWRLKNSPGTFNERTRGIRALAEGIRYFTTRTGMLASGSNSVNVFFRTRPDLSSPDAQIQVFPGSYNTVRDRQLERLPGITLAPTLLRPESRGSVHARSKDPKENPAIIINILGTEADRQASLITMRFTRRLVETRAMQPYFEHEMTPGKDVHTDEEFMAFARETGTSNWHAGGSCRMGADFDPMAVVDSRLRVRGVTGLRVVDASIMPLVSSGNTNAPTIMIAEKAADIILEDARDKVAVA